MGARFLAADANRRKEGSHPVRARPVVHSIATDSDEDAMPSSFTIAVLSGEANDMLRQTVSIGEILYGDSSSGGSGCSSTHGMAKVDVLGNLAGSSSTHGVAKVDRVCNQRVSKAAGSSSTHGTAKVDKVGNLRVSKATGSSSTHGTAKVDSVGNLNVSAGSSSTHGNAQVDSVGNQCVSGRSSSTHGMAYVDSVCNPRVSWHAAGSSSVGSKAWRPSLRHRSWPPAQSSPFGDSQDGIFVLPPRYCAEHIAQR